MNTTTDITVLEQLLVVNLDVHIWSARRKLMPLDLSNAELPPEELASLGSKRICNPEDLKPFATLKARAVSVLERNGIRFLHGWAIPEARMEEIVQELASVRNEFNTAKESFLQSYEHSVQDWIARHPNWGKIIADSVVSEEYVRSRMDFRWQIFRVVPPSEQSGTDNLEEDVRGLGKTLYEEIAKSATEIWHRCYEGKTEVTRKALSPLKAIHSKLLGLSFVEPRVSSIATLMETAFHNIPRRGLIRGGTLLMLQGLVSLLRTPQELVAHGQKILEGRQNPDDILFGLTDTPFQLPESEILPEFSESGEDDASVPMPPAMESYGLW